MQGVEVGFRVLEEAAMAGVFLELPELLDLDRFLLIEFWLARVAGDLPLLMGLSVPYSICWYFISDFRMAFPVMGINRLSKGMEVSEVAGFAYSGDLILDLG